MIYLASDHAGFALKEVVKRFLQESDEQFVDVGPHEYNQDDDYPDYIIPAAFFVAQSKKNRGIIFGGSGQGEAIAANKVKGIRASVYYGGPSEIVILSREHNNSNVLSLGARFMEPDEAKRIVGMWLATDFPMEERYHRRIAMVDNYEQHQPRIISMRKKNNV